MKNETSTPVIFMLEQDQDDRDITETILKEIGYQVTLHFFHDQQGFFSALSQAAKLPGVILLSYTSVAGKIIEVLHLLKSNPRYTRIPVIVLSESASSSDIKDAYFFGASSFITKPFTNNETVNKISGFINYWFNIVELPEN